MLAHRLSEIDTPAFREFLQEAAASFQHNLKRLQTKPEDVMPWKVNGERWHLGDKGFPAGQEGAVGPGPAAAAAGPGARGGADDGGATGTSATPSRCGCRASAGPGRSGGPRTAAGLDCRFLGKKGQFNLSRMEGLAARRRSITSSARTATCCGWCSSMRTTSQAAKLKELLAEHLRGFREVFGKGGASRESV